MVHADLVIHVHDATSEFVGDDADDVTVVLQELGLDKVRQQQSVLHIFNKTDLLTGDDQRVWLGKKYAGGVFASAQDGSGIADVLEAIDRYLGRDAVQTILQIRPEDGAARAWLYAHAHIRDPRFDDAGCESMTVSISLADHDRFLDRWPPLDQAMQWRIKSA